MKLANKIIELTENKVAKDVVNFINKEMKKKFLKDEWTDWESGEGSDEFEKAVKDLMKKKYGLDQKVQGDMDGSAIASALIAVSRGNKKQMDKWQKEFKDNLNK
jgi:hypothetical protein